MTKTRGVGLDCQAQAKTNRHRQQHDLGVLSMHNSGKTVLNFSKAKANDVSVIADFQKQRLDIWLEHLQTDSSVIYEYSNNHDQCQRCTHSLDENRRRGV